VRDPDRQHVPAAGDPRPWERPGAVRRDCAPHRGRLLLAFGVGALFGATLSAVLSLVTLLLLGPALFAPAWLAGVAVGGTALALARRDLRRMDAGLMDPEGRPATADARSLALGALPLSVVALVLAVALRVLTARAF
jgi:hypothetical protein